MTKAPKIKEPIDYAAIPLRYTTNKRWQYWRYDLGRWVPTDKFGAGMILYENLALNGRHQEITRHLIANPIDRRVTTAPSNTTTWPA
jgi:hypothetical protein